MNLEFPVDRYIQYLRDLEEIKIRDLRRNFGCGFHCNVGRIVGYVTGVTAENTAEETSKARILIFSKCLSLVRPDCFQCGTHKTGASRSSSPRLTFLKKWPGLDPTRTNPERTVINIKKYRQFHGPLPQQR